MPEILGIEQISETNNTGLTGTCFASCFTSDWTLLAFTFPPRGRTISCESSGKLTDDLEIIVTSVEKCHTIAKSQIRQEKTLFGR